MYHVAVIALLALAVIKLVDFVVDYVPTKEVAGIRSVLIIAGGIGAAWILDYSLFEGFGIAIRDRAMGVWITGLLIAGTTVAWRAMFHWLTGDAATGDESLGEHRPLHKVA